MSLRGRGAATALRLVTPIHARDVIWRFLFRIDKPQAVCEQMIVRHILALCAAVIATAISALVPAAHAQKAGATFAGVRVTPGATVRANVPLSPQQQSYVSEAGNAVPPHTVATFAAPPGFDPAKAWPVLVIFSTSDHNRQNGMDLVQFYRDSALAEGWALLAGDGPNPAPRDTAGWRAGHTLAAIDALQRSFPGAKNWPIAVAGYSGGAKRAGNIAPLLVLAGCRVTGIFLTGINEDRLSEAYRKFRPGSGFLRTPIYLSSGEADPTARLRDHYQVRASMQRSGFTNVRHEVFAGGHIVKPAEVRAALRWFRGG
jgi:hypothetical protein